MRTLVLPLFLLVGAAVEGVRVAVYEHEAFTQDVAKSAVTRNEAISVMKKNLEMYDAQARFAAAQNAKMIVYPENGLYGSGLSRASIKPYLEDIPDTGGPAFCPCTNPNVSQWDHFLQHQLSCLAYRNRIYIAATAADLKQCTGQFKAGCPPTGQWHFNTAVVYEPSGCLVARYHKQHLFFEAAFDTPPRVEMVSFTTPFGKFGLAICFDLLFKSPAVDLVEKHGVETLIFPTAWMDALPLFSAIGYHSAWAAGLQVNVLAANCHLPSIRMSGSGIYTPRGSVGYTCLNKSESARLVVAELPPLDRTGPPPSPTPLNISLGELIRRVEAPHFTFKSWLFHDHFKFILMRSRVGLKKVCEHDFCCYLRYEMDTYLEDELYAFGAFWGRHTFEGAYYIQVCAVVKCRLGDLHTTCGSPVMSARTRFRSLYIDGTFNSSYVFPIVLTDNMTLPSPGEVQFGKFPFPFMESKTGFARPLITAALFTRLYDKDAAARLPAPPTALSAIVAALLLWRHRAV